MSKNDPDSVRIGEVADDHPYDEELTERGSRRGEVVVPSPNGTGPAFKDQCHEVDVACPSAQVPVGAHRKGAQQRSFTGPAFKDQVRRDVKSPAQVSERAGAYRMVGPGAAAAPPAAPAPATTTVGEYDVSLHEAEERVGTPIVPNAELVRDDCSMKIIEAKPTMPWRRKMLIWAIVVLVAVGVGVTAGVLGARSSLSEHAYRRPDPDAGFHYSTQRGPCPGLNALANHGYINRDGKNIDLRDVADACELVYGADADDILDILLNSTYSKVRTEDDEETPLINLFDLYALDHDASFVRQDPYYQPYPQFDQSLFDRLVSNATADGVLTGLQSEAFQRQRILESRHDNPEVFLNEKIGHAMALQGCLLQFFGTGPVQETVRVEELESFLKDEKIPEGFVLRGESGRPPILRTDYASQESRWRESVMGVLTAPLP